MITGYIFAFIAVFCGAVKGFCGKKISGYTSDLPSASYSNFLRMLICILIGFALTIIDGGFNELKIPPIVLMASIIAGVSTAVFVITWLFAVRRGAYMMVDVFLLLGVILPIVLSNFFYGEEIKLSDIIGCVLLLIATFVLCSYNNEVKHKIRPLDLLILILVGCANGMVGFSQKMFIYNSTSSSASAFNFYTYVFSAMILGIFFVISKSKEKNTIKEKLPSKLYIYILIRSICLFAVSYFNTLAAKELSATQLYPISQGSAIILSTLMSATFFGEKIRPKLIVGLIFAFAGLLVINLL